MDQVDIARLQDSIDRLADSFNSAAGRTSGASSQTASALKQLTNSFLGLKTASDVVEDSFTKLKRRQDAYEFAISGSIRGIINLTSSAISTAQSFYNAEGAFSSAAGGINLLNSTISKFSNATGKLLQKFPGWAQVGATAFNGISAVVDFYNQAAQAQLSAMQNQLDSYRQLSAAGATFGGSLFYLQNAVSTAGIPMRQFVKLVSSSAEYLQAMGVGITTATQDVLRLTKTQLMADESLLMLAGGFDELAQFTAQYQAQQAMLGKLEIDSTKDQVKAVTDYVKNQRLLSEITGKNAAQLAAEQRRRMTDLGFQQAVARATASGNQAAADNLQIAAEYFGQFGPLVAEAAKQMAIGGRQGLNPEVAAAMSQFPGMLDLIEQSMQSAKQRGQEGFKDDLRTLTETYRPLIQQQAEQASSTFAGINAQITGVGKTIADTTATINNALNTIATNLPKILAQQTVGRTSEEQEAAKRDAKTLADMFKEAESTRLALQAKQDQNIAEQFVKMTSLIQAGFTAQEVAITAQQVILSGGNAFIEAIAELKRLLGNIRTPSSDQTPAVPQSPINALGDVAGIIQPQAVNPAAAGTVPNIDLSPLVNIMTQQVAQNNDILRTLSDSKDTQEKMLYSLG